MPYTASLSTRRAVAMLLALAAMLLGLTIASQAGAVSPARAAGNVVYNSIPVPLATNYPSLNFTAQNTNELGDLIQLGGTDRVLDDVTFTFSSWACEEGIWASGDCDTTPGSSFIHPITLNVYAVAAGGNVGALLATTTEPVQVPYRPSVADECNTGYGPNCVDGFAFNHTFSLTSLAVALPNQVIVTVAFNTSSEGYDPIGPPFNSDYDFINVAAPNAPVTVGADVDTDVVIINALDTGDELEPQSDWSGFGLGINVTAHSALAATGSETNLLGAGFGGALLLAGAMALVLTARRRQVTAE